MAADILLIRGLFRSKYHWGTFAKTLQAFFPDRSISCVDIPGAGDLYEQTSPNSIEGMVESIRSQLKSNQQYSLISISMGGMIALKWAERYPEEIDSVVCINTSLKGFSPFYQRMIPTNYLSILRAVFSTPDKKALLTYAMVSNNALDNKVISNWVQIDKDYPIRPMNFFRQLMAAINAEVKKPDCKLLFISSLSDRLVSYKATQAIAKQWHAPLIENPHDGHDIALDNPDWLCAQLVSWIKSQHS